MSEYIYSIVDGVKSFLTGMGLTFKHFKEKKNLVATLQYPNEKWPKPERSIGFDHKDYNVIRSRLHVDIDDCIGCLQCEKVCPVDCIKIDTLKPPKDNDYDCGKTSFDTQKKMIVPRFTIDMSECMYCDLCVHPCPEECIYMVGGPNEPKHEIDYEFSKYERHGLIYEFATATDQDILDVGGESYLKERKDKQERKLQGEKLEGKVKSDVPESNDIADEPDKAKHKDPLLEIFNIVPDKVARGIAKKAVVYGKRNNFDFSAMADEVAKRIEQAGKTSSEMSTALENLRNYSVPEDTNDSKISDSQSEKTENNVKKETPSGGDFSIKSLDFIEDKMIRGIAKKSFMAGKRSELDDNGKIDLIIKDLESSEKITQDIKDSLLNLKVSSSSESPVETKEIEKKNILFDIKALNIIEDKVIRSSSKKIYMGGKRAGKTSSEIIDDILKEFSDKIDDDLKTTLEGLK